MSGEAVNRTSPTVASLKLHTRTPRWVFVALQLIVMAPMLLPSRALAQEGGTEDSPLEENGNRPNEEPPREEGDDEREEREESYDSSAREAFDRGDYRQALEALNAAQDVSPATARLYNMAQCHEGLGEDEQAIELYQQYLVARDALEGRRRIARQRIERLSDRGVQSPTPEAPPRQDTLRPLRVAFYSLVGVTSVLTLGFGVLGGVTLARHEEFVSFYQEDPSVQDLSSQGSSLALATDVVLGLSIVSAVVTLVVGLIWLRRHRRVSHSPRPGFEVVEATP